jgi:uncharacterized protein (TIGR02246 family)
MNKSSFATSLALLALGVACTPAAPPPVPPPPDAAAIRTALKAQQAKFLPLFQSKDAAGVAALFTSDATWIQPDASTFVGTAAITAGAKAVFDSIESFTSESDDIDRLIVVSDSEAVAFSHIIGSLKLKGKKAERHNNPFVDHWKKGSDGVWRVAYEVNADGPIPDKKP